MNIEKLVIDTIGQYGMIKEGELVLVGVSGGPDSIALLDILNRNKEKLAITLHAAHLNHSFRGKEADEEAAWVEAAAGKWGIPCTVGCVDVPALIREKGLSPQDAGHLARKDFFLGLAEKLGAAKIALGHQADDQAETVLMHFLVGAGPEGLRGIVPVTEMFIRPLLFVRRRDIESYCEMRGLDPRRDPSNKKDVYLRNKIRNQLLPWLTENINPNLTETLNRTARIYWAEEEYMQQKTAELAETMVVWGDTGVKLALAGLRGLEPALQRRLIRWAYHSLTKGQGLPYLHVEEVRELAEKKETGKMLHLPAGVTVKKTRPSLLFYYDVKFEKKCGI